MVGEVGGSVREVGGLVMLLLSSKEESLDLHHASLLIISINLLLLTLLISIGPMSLYHHFWVALNKVSLANFFFCPCFLLKKMVMFVIFLLLGFGDVAKKAVKGSIVGKVTCFDIDRLNVIFMKCPK